MPSGGDDDDDDEDGDDGGDEDGGGGGLKPLNYKRCALLYGRPNPRMVSEWCHMPETEAAVTELIDECTSTRLPEKYRSKDGDEWRKLPRLGMREPPDMRPRASEPTAKAMCHFWAEVIPRHRSAPVR